MAITINGSGTITGISAGGYPDGSVTAADIESSLDLTGKTVTLPSGTGGKILQVVSVTKTDKATLTSLDTWTDISGMSAAITPSSSSNKIFVQVMLSHGMDSSPGDAAFKLLRGSTDIAIGDADGSARRVTVGSQTRDFDEMKNSNISFLDSPATTSATTYKIQWMIRSGLFRLNSEGSSSNANISYDRGISTITLFEVAA